MVASHPTMGRPPPALRRRLRRVHAAIRDARLLAAQFRGSIAVFLLVIFGGGTVLWSSYEAKTLTWPQAVYAAYQMVFFQSSLDFPSAWHLQLMFFAIPLLGLVVLVDGIARFGALLVDKSKRGEEWQKVMAGTYRDHLVLCGLGHVGYRVAEQLMKLGEEFVAVGHDTKFATTLREAGVPVLIGDVRQESLLRAANVPLARSIVIATDDDLANLDVAITARNLSPAIRVVARMFDSELATKVQQAFGIHMVFSTSALAAPDIALAALDKHVRHSFYVGDALLNVAELEVAATSRFTNRTLEELEREMDVTVVVHRRGTALSLHPTADTRLQPGDRILLLGTLERLGELARAGLAFHGR
ncbi:MAG: NAD-binding protein [Deltaproteobacteria bacterium]|nr:NAD-binding protein [Deltaproteobacteria bacterium]